MKKSCKIYHGSNNQVHIKCRNKYFTSLKVQVRHSDTGRRTWQTWHLCRKCFDEFMNLEGQGYFAWYKKNPYKIAFVIDFKLLGAI